MRVWTSTRKIGVYRWWVGDSICRSYRVVRFAGLRSRGRNDRDGDRLGDGARDTGRDRDVSPDSQTYRGDDT